MNLICDGAAKGHWAFEQFYQVGLGLGSETGRWCFVVAMRLKQYGDFLYGLATSVRSLCYGPRQQHLDSSCHWHVSWWAVWRILVWNFYNLHFAGGRIFSCVLTRSRWLHRLSLIPPRRVSRPASDLRILLSVWGTCLSPVLCGATLILSRLYDFVSREA